MYCPWFVLRYLQASTATLRSNETWLLCVLELLHAEIWFKRETDLNQILDLQAT